MTVGQQRGATGGQPGGVTLGHSRARREQVVALMVAALLLGLILLLQPTLAARRAALVPEDNASMQQLAVEFPKLTLGGFRGFLALYLWQEAEDDKNERRWMELETKYNYIGKLEPCFVTVWVFNAWNEAYNLSAQWHDIDAKFKWVLDGLDHLYEGEKHNPDNPDIILEQAQMYFLKLGTSFEKIEYRQKWRDRIRDQYLLNSGRTETLETHQRVRSFILRPQFNAELLERDSQHPGQLGYGIRITGLDPEKPREAIEYRYGVSPFYFAYCEYRRMLATGLPTTMGYQVVHAYPGMSLRLWCRDDLYYANSVLAEMFADGSPTAQIANFNDKVFELRTCYENVQRNAPLALREFDKHLIWAKQQDELQKSGESNYRSARGIHYKHILETQFMQAIGAAERRMLEGLVAWQLAGRQVNDDSRRQLLDSLGLYDKAIGALQRYMDEIMPGANPDRADYEKLQGVMRTRMAGVKALLAAAPGTTVDFKFLETPPVEK